MTTVFDSIQLPGLSKYRRPNLLWVSGTQVQTESGITDGNASNTQILFSDGQLRTASLATEVVLDITRVASLSGSKQSGIRTGSVVNNTWYAIYAVKETDATGWVLVADTVLPIKTNYSTLNTNFNTNGWEYIGLIRNGDQQSNPTGILNFIQVGNHTLFIGVVSGQNTAVPGFGYIIATTAGAASLTYTYSAGTSGIAFPNNISFVDFVASTQPVTGNSALQDSAASSYYDFDNTSGPGYVFMKDNVPVSKGIKVTPASSIAIDLVVHGFTDTVLGIGSNPLL